ncbi:aminopeptidase N-like [Ischnura elegans]|uniref:aminopeptidase N-like n=1 Tax=Ischnura elegans TaxID=197161 RepID=UPI001ED8BBE8|nr:aminopeptidase N-like [Ischnura elegans]
MRMSPKGLPNGYEKLMTYWSCKYGNKACISEGVKQFSKWRLTRNNLILKTPNAYCSGIYDGGKEEWDFLWMVYEATTDPTETAHILDALGCSRDKEILKGYLLKVIEDDVQIRKHELERVFVAVSKNVGVDLSVDFLVENFEIINARYTSKSIAAVISGLASDIGSKEKAIQMKEFLQDREEQLSPSKRAVEKAIETIDSNLEWSEAFLPVIESWLAQNYS